MASRHITDQRVRLLKIATASLLTLVGSRNLQAAQETVPHALGEQKVAVVVAEVPGTPVSTSIPDLRDIFFGKANSVDSYLREVSYGKTWVTGDVFGPYELSRTYGTAMDINEFNEAVRATLKLASTDLDLSKFNHLVLIYPVPGSSGWQGNAGLGCVIEGYCPAGITMVFLGASAQPTPRDKVYAVSLHEFLHEMGEGHAFTLSYAPETLGVPDPRFTYASFDSGDFLTIDGGSLSESRGDVLSSPMGGNSQCSGVIATHLSAPFKYHVGWLDRGPNLAELETGGTYRLAPLENSATGTQALRVRRLPGNDLWLWIEYRQPLGLDQALSSCTPQVFSGAVVYYEMPHQTDSVVAIPVCPLGGRLCGQIGLLDFTANTTPGDFRDAALASGQTWSDPYGPLTIRVGLATPQGIDVTVTYDASCATFSPAGRQHGRSAETGTIPVNAPPGCNWTASTFKNPNWLSITSGKAGSGAGQVTYTAAPNDTYHTRNGWITIARQVFAVTQDYEKVAPVALRSDPDNGRSAVGGPDPGFDLYYYDKNGGDDIRRAYVLFADQADTRNACEVEYDVVAKRYRVADDAGTGWSEWSVQWGQPMWPNPGNSQCSVRYAAPAGPGGDQFYTSFHFTFQSSFAGAKNIYLRAVDAAGLESGPWQKVGTWTIYVNHPPAAVSVTPDSGSGSSQLFQFVFRDPDGSFDLRQVWVIIGTGTDPLRCQFLFRQSDSEVFLEADSGGVFQSGLSIGSPAILQNKACAVDVSGASVSAAGTDLTLRVPVSFNPTFAGAKTIYGFALDYMGATDNWRKLGAWTAPQISCSYSLDPGRIDVGPDETKGTVAVKTDAPCAWLASGASWIVITSGRTGIGNGKFSFTALTNASTAPRTGTISVGGQDVLVTQAGRSTRLGPPLADSFFNGASFAALRAFPTGTLVTIMGTDLAPVTRTWNESDFAGNKLPTQLYGVSVDINGKPAYIYYISPTQLNVLMPDDDGQAAWNLRVKTPGGSEPYTHGLVKTSYSPGLFMFDPEDRKYVAARHQDGVLAAKPGLYAGATSLPAKPGEIIMLFGTGFGPTKPPCPAGEIVAAAAPTESPVTIRIGGQVAEVKFAGLVSSGLYQLNLVVPANTPDGDQRVVAEIAGIQSQANAYLTVQK